MAEYQQKENREATREKKFEKIVTGSVETRPNNGRKLLNMFFADDVRNVGSFALMDVLIPAAKKAIVDIVTDGVRMAMYGSVKDPGRKTEGKIAYRNFYDDPRDYRRNDYDRGGRYDFNHRFEYDDILYETAREAEDVRRKMLDALDRYRVVTVADLYDMSGLSIPSYTTNNYGWTSLRDIDIVRVRGRYMLRLPKALPID